MPDVSLEGLTPDSEEHLTLLSTSFPTRCVIPDTEHRAISLEQLRRVFDFASLHCRCWHDFFKLSPTVGQLLSIEVLNLYHLDAWLIRPATKAENCSMVELLAKKPQAPQWFISHWWGEAIKAFVGCVERHAEIRELPGTAGYWVCAYANRQHALSQELTADPRETSFFRALNLSQGVLLILDEATETSGPATPFTRIWCAFEEFVALSPRPGPPLLLDIAAAERGQSQLLTDGVAPADEEGARRLGAGYPAGKVRSDREKSFPLEVLRAGLTLELEKAKASQEEDRRHILNCIAGQDLHAEPLMESPSYTKVNQTLRAIFAVAGWRQAVERDIVEVLRLPETLGESEREELVLDFTGSVVLHDACAAPLAAALRAAPLRQTLRRLELSGRWCTEISHQFLIHLAPAIPQDLNSLTLRFGFAAKNIHQEGIEALAKAIPRTLTELFLDFSDGSRLGDESLKAIAASLPLSLERLTLGLAGWVNLTDHGLTALAQRLPNHLTFLKIDCYIMSTRAVIGDLGLAALGEKLQKLEKLQQLDLSFKCNGTIGDGGLSALGAALPRSLSALRLVFDNCSKITDAGLAALAAGFPPGLEKLQLFCNDCGHLGDGALAALGSAPLEQLKHLELALNGARLSDAGLAAVRLRSASLSLLSLSLANAELRSGGVAALAQQLPSEVQALHLCLSGCEGLEDLALSALGENLNAELQSLTMSLDNCLKLSDQGLAGLAQKMPQLNTLRMYLSGCDGMGDAGYAALFQRLPKSLQMLELEPGGAFSAAGLCALQTALLERCDVQLRLDCSYTQVDEDLAAELIGPGGLATLRRWQPEVVAPDPAQPPKGPPARPSSPAPVPEKAAPTVLKVSEVIPQTLPSPRTFQDMSDTKPRAPKAAAATKAAAVAKHAAKASPLSMCGAQVLRQPRQPPAGGLLQSAQASAKAKSRGVGASRSAVKL